MLGNDDIVFWFVSQRMFPPIVTAFALYLMYTEIGRLGFKLVDTYWGLTLCYVAFSLPIVVWLMRDFFAALPVEVEEAAMVDNVPRWRIFLEIVVPMATPGLLATFMITLELRLERVPVRAVPDQFAIGRPCRSSSPARTASAATNGGRSRPPP